MNLQGRDLSLDMIGADVALLHEELMQLTFTIPDDELQDARFGLGTQQVVTAFQGKNNLAPTGVVDEATAASINQAVAGLPPLEKSLRVAGQIRYSDGTPFANGRVRAFHIFMGGRTLLEAQDTDAAGHFDIRYSPKQFEHDANTGANLLLTIHGRDGRQLADTGIIFNARPEEDAVAISLPQRGPSEYERLFEAVNARLNGRKLEELTDLEIALLADATEQDIAQIGFLVAAHRLMRETEQTAKVEAEAFYGLLRQGMPADLPALLAQTIDSLLFALQQAIADNTISADFATKIDQTLDQFQKLSVQSALDLPIGLLLGTALEDPGQQADFLTLYVDHQGPIEDFWQDLSESEEFEDEVAGLQLTMQLGAVTKLHVPLVEKLRSLAGDQKITSMRDLARYDVDGWLNLIHGQNADGAGFPPDVPGETEEEKARNYAMAMAHMVEDIFPSDFVARRLESETDPFEGKADLSTFFHNVIQIRDEAQVPGATRLAPSDVDTTDFNITTTNIELYLAQHPEALQEVNDEAVLKRQLHAVQRLYRVAPRYDEMLVLLKDGLDSAHSIVQMGRNAFVQKYSAALADRAQVGVPSATTAQAMGQDGAALEGQVRAKSIFASARQRNATAHVLLGEFGQSFNQALPVVLPARPLRIVPEIPSWAELFGPLDLCECEHCRSVYSPAAYLVDILDFLAQRRSQIEGLSAKDVLFMRRLDIGDIELTCENTNIAVPYVDLVNEVLENMVSPIDPFEPFLLDFTLKDDLDRSNVSQALRNAFVPALSESAVIRIRHKGEAWSIDDTAFTYMIAVAGEPKELRVTSRILQTSGTPEELSANPQYLNAGAYDTLRQQVYPWNLPFDLPLEEARAYLGHLGVQRHEVMTTFLESSLTSDPVAVAIATEQLGLTSFERQIVTGGFEVRLATTTNLDALSGFPTVDGVTVALDDRVLVKDQTNAAENGIYVARADAWLRMAHSVNLPGFVNVKDGGTNQQTGWLLTEGVNGAISVAPLQPWQFWGRPAGDPGSWAVDLSLVRTLLDTSGLSYQELSDLLETRFINPEQQIEINPISSEQGDCDPNNLRLTIPDDDDSDKVLDRIHRFVRLWRKLGWTMRDLDKAITALKPAGLSDLFLTQLSHVKRLQSELNMSVVSLLSWWAPIDTAAYIERSTTGQSSAPSLYAQLFRNKAVTNPLDPAFTEDPAQLSGKLSEHIPTITAALGISANDFSLLFNEANIIPTIPDSNPDPKHPNKQIPDDRLSLDYLSRLYRHATLPKALGLPIHDYLSALNLIGEEPFASTADTVLWVERIGKALDAGFTIAELDYLLRHSFEPASGIAPTDDEIAPVLDDIRRGLQKIAVENTFRDDPGDPNGLTTDPNGDLTKKKLALLSWDSTLIEQVVATLGDAVTYQASLDPRPDGLVLPNETGVDEVPLAALPPSFVFPSEVHDVVTYDKVAQKVRASRFLSETQRTLLRNASSDPGYRAAIEALFKLQDELQGKISYDDDTHTLRFVGLMTQARRSRLKSASPDARYQAAIDALFDAPRRFISRNMRTFSVQNYAQPLEVLPAGVTFPNALKGKVYYNATAHELHFIGAMTELEHDALLNLSDDLHYRPAVDALFTTPDTLVPQMGDAFLTASGPNNDAAALFDNPTTAEARFLHVLKKLLPYLRTTLSQRLVIQKISTALQLETKAAEELLSKWVSSPAHPAITSIAEFVPTPPDFLAAPFAESDLNVVLSSSGFKAQFETFTKLHKVALVVTRFRIKPAQLHWAFGYPDSLGQATVEWLNLNNLPLSPGAPSSDLFKAWERLVDVFRLRHELPRGEALLPVVLEMARAPGTTQEGLLEEINRHTRWNPDDLQFLVGANGLNVAFPADFQDEVGLARLQTCFALLKRLGMSAKQCRAIGELDAAPFDTAAEIARGIRQAVRAKHDEAQWLNVARPLRDILREKQRAALVAYLVGHGVDGKPRWKDANELYAYLLIDVEMSPCMLTSRIKQAISSAQLFVQRCLMSLEPDVRARLDVDKRWHDWKWMKNYRVWEANRKIFLYPENWVEPELRDDKSPFFKELEDELLQDDLTAETAETAFLHYLEKLDQVARLEIVGEYHQEEFDDETGLQMVDVLHVLGRTRGTPHIYYYRRRVDSARWTPWEKVDVDIEGDHLIPVIWNRRLYLFWPIFTEKTERKPIKMPAPDGELEEPARFWEIQLAWSELKSGKWAAKKVSSEPEPVKLPTLLEDSFGSPRFAVTKDRISFKAIARDDLTILCYQNFLVIRTNRAEFSPGMCKGGWRLTGCDSNLLRVEAEEVADDTALAPFSWLLSPQGSKPEFMMFAGDAQLQLFEGDFGDKHELADLIAAKKDVPVLKATPSPFSILYPHQDEQFASQRPFFYQDDTRTFFVIPAEFQVPRLQVRAGTLDPAWTDVLSRPYLKQPERPSDGQPTQPGNPVDPPIGEPSSTKKLRFTTPISGGGAVSSTVAPRALVAGHSPSMSATVALQARGDGRANGMNGVISARLALGNTGSASLAMLAPAAKGAAVGQPGFDDSGLQRIETRYRFQAFYHPYVCRFIRELNRDGVDGLMYRQNQQLSKTFFEMAYSPANVVIMGDPEKKELYPKEDVAFAHDDAYSLYNWELFFHVPLLIADRLSKNQRFEEAQQWFHYIFDPTDASGLEPPQRYWRTRPFYEATRKEYYDEQIDKLLKAQTKDPAKTDPDQDSLDDQVQEWRDHPFNPHLVARLRTAAYPKTVVMKYIDNLIGWADQLFRRDTIESINEATQLYILAAEILGRRPETIPPHDIPGAQTFNSLQASPVSSSSPLIGIEHLVPSSSRCGVIPPADQPLLTLPELHYFCVPPNDKLLGYWDTVADRLFKIRHCMNIEGVVRQLPLFEPPIDPALLVRAAAAGVDISSALNDVNAAVPHYRFNVMAQKAGELCAELKSLGAALLSALEKRDAEALALLRSSHEIKVLNAVRQVRQQQIDEARETLEGLQKARELAVIRHDYYANLAFMNQWEIAHLALVGTSVALQLKQIGADIAAGTLHLIPNAKAGSPTTIGVTYGGANIASAVQAFGAAMGTSASMLNTIGSMSATMGSYRRRADDWKLQERLAAKEMEQIDKQIAAAEIRLAVAERELQNHELQIENAKQADAFMRDKFTNRELYDWMVGQISGIYFQSYQLAYDVAKRAERAYRFELGLQDSNFIQFGYWDSLKKGLLAGERLSYDLKRMEVAYLDQNRREYEITRHVSLAALDAVALIQLKQTGECFVSLPEVLFDLDVPGHYMRRLKSVGLTIPCVTGPYTGVNCTLTLLKSTIRHSNTLLAGKYERQDNDSRFADSVGAIQSIVTSSAQNDSGLFEPTLRDERYLPFEGAGAISEWRLELPQTFRQFDYDTISDVVLHVRYTARDGGAQLKERAEGTLQEALRETPLAEGQRGLVRLFSTRHEFPNEWHRFLHPASATGDQTLTLALTKDRFPFLFQGMNINVTAIEIYVQIKPHLKEPPSADTLKLTLEPGTTPSDNNPLPLTAWNDLLRAEKNVPHVPDIWTLKAWLAAGGGARQRLDPESIEDIVVVCHYSV